MLNRITFLSHISSRIKSIKDGIQTKFTKHIDLSKETVNEEYVLTGEEKLSMTIDDTILDTPLKGLTPTGYHGDKE